MAIAAHIGLRCHQFVLKEKSLVETLAHLTPLTPEIHKTKVNTGIVRGL